MMDAMYFNLTTELGALFATGKAPQKNRHRSPSTVVPYSVFRCRDDRYVAVICIMERHWETLAEVIGQPQLVNDERFTRRARFKNESALNQLIESWTLTLDQTDVLQRLRDAKIPAAPVRTIEDVYGNAHMTERGSLVRVDHPTAGEMILPTSPIRYSEFGAPELSIYPELGSANDMILGQTIDAAELARLADEGVI